MTYRYRKDRQNTEEIPSAFPLTNCLFDESAKFASSLDCYHLLKLDISDNHPFLERALKRLICLINTGLFGSNLFSVRSNLCSMCIAPSILDFLN